MCLFVLVLSGMDPLWDTEVCTWTQLDCLWTSSQSKPCFIQNGDKWDCVLCRRLDCPSKYVFEGNYFKWIFSFSASFCWSLSFFPLKLQCYEGKPLFEFDRTRMFRSGLVGFTLHGSLSHYYYQFCEVIIVVHIWPVGLFVYFCRWPEVFAFVSRLFFLSKIGGWSLLKLPLTKQCGRQFGTASILCFWGSYVLNPLPIYIMN